MLATIKKRVAVLSDLQFLKLLALNAIVAAICVQVINGIIDWNVRNAIRSVENRIRSGSADNHKTRTCGGLQPTPAAGPTSSQQYVALLSMEDVGTPEDVAWDDRFSGLAGSSGDAGIDYPKGGANVADELQRIALEGGNRSLPVYLQLASFFVIVFVLQFLRRPNTKSAESKTEPCQLIPNQNGRFFSDAICGSYLFVFEDGRLVDVDGLGLQWLGMKRESDYENFGIEQAISLMDLCEDLKQQIVERLTDPANLPTMASPQAHREKLGRIEDSIYEVNVVGLGCRQLVTIRDKKTKIDHRLERWEQLERAKLELDEVVYFASHDLRAPLNSISMLVEMILDEPSFVPSEETMTSFNMLRRRVSRMDMLFTELLRYSRVGRLLSEKQAIDVKESIHAVIDETNAPSFRFEVTGNSYQIDTFSEEFKTCIKELVDNAVLHHERPDGFLKISLRRHREFLEIRFANDGPPILPKHHDKIFKMFGVLQRRDEAENAGIGLPIVRKTVEAFGGNLTIEEPTLGGVDFVLRWPIQSVAPSAAQRR